MPSTPPTWSRAIAALLDVAFPLACPACGRSDLVDTGFCEGCDADLACFTGPVCHRCSNPLPGPATVDDCPACREERWAFERVVALGPYSGLLRRLMLEAKGRRGEAASVAIGRLLGHRLDGEELSEALIVPIPQHWSRRMVRRADGVAALASGLSAATGRPVLRALARTRATRRQTEIAPSDRLANVRSAFAVRRLRRLEGRPILLVDDIFTTGATCQTAAQALRRAGAARVTAVVATRRVGPG